MDNYIPLKSARTIGHDREFVDIEARECQPAAAPEHCIEIKLELYGTARKRTQIVLVYLTKMEAVELGEHLIKIGAQRSPGAR
jgi:hypothetical protein